MLTATREHQANGQMDDGSSIDFSFTPPARSLMLTAADHAVDADDTERQSE
ncbi:MAG: hypothetical protein ACLSF6_06070 [Evtepia gabavorous]